MPDSAPPAAPRVSLIIPACNEADNLAPLLEEIVRAMGGQSRSWEVLFVDDGSSDGTLDVLRRLARQCPEARYLAFAANRGQSAALAAGFQEARGAVFVTLDADLQNDPADIPALLDAFDQGWDMVAGRRIGRKDGLIKRLASRVANSVRNRLTHESVTDTGCSLKVMRAAMATRLPVFRGMHRFLPTLMKMQGATVLEAPVRHRPRLSGASKYGIWDRAFSGLCDALAVRWMQSRRLDYAVRERGGGDEGKAGH
jgi:glycosyltransferase involved in cell wall biosynthesis